MAEHVEITLIDDLDGSPAAEKVTLALNGKGVELDLSKRNFAKLQKLLQPYMDAGRPAKGSSGGKRKAPAGGMNYGEAREWAAQNRIKTTARGRLPVAFMEAFAAGDVAAARKALK